MCVLPTGELEKWLSGQYFSSGALFLEENMDHTETFFQGWVCSIFFLGLIIECVIRTPKMNHVFIYIYIDRVFWKINRDNNQWVGYHQLSAKCSSLAVIIFVYSAGHLLRTENPLLRTNIITLRTENPLLRTNIITLRTENPLLRTHFVIYILF